MKTNISNKRNKVRRRWLISSLALLSLWPAKAFSLTFIDGDMRFFPYFSRSSEFEPNSAFVFTSAPGGYSLLLNELNASVANQTPGPSLLFANTRFENIALELEKTEAISQPDFSVADSSKTAFVPLTKTMKAKFMIATEGDYQVWLKLKGEETKYIVQIELDDFLYEPPYHDLGMDWLKLAGNHFKKGKHSISLISRGKPKKHLEPFKEVVALEALVINEEKFRAAAVRLRNSRSAFLFYKTELERTLSRSFYVPQDGLYEVSRLIEPREEKLPTYKINAQFDQSNPEWINYAPGGPAPAVLFGSNFYPTTLMFYPMQDGAWRWMSSGGRILILNPFSSPIEVQLELNIASLNVDRNVDMELNGKHVERLLVVGPKTPPSESLQRKITEMREAGTACGPGAIWKTRSVTLRPGINTVVLSATPGAVLINNLNPLSIAIGENVRILGIPATAKIGWANSAAFRTFWRSGAMVIRDDYSKNDEEVAWISKPLDKINLRDFPIFSMRYNWRQSLQAMDIGFDIQAQDGSVQRLIVSVPESTAEGSIYKLDLLTAAWRVYGMTSDPKLVGINFFPHKFWGAAPLSNEESVNFAFNYIRLASAEGSVVELGKESPKEVSEIGKGIYSVTKNEDSLVVSMDVGGDKPPAASVEVNIPLSQYPKTQASRMILPLARDTQSGLPGSQSLKPLVGYDTNGDNRPDVWVPAGRRFLLSKWKVVNRDIRYPYALYDTELPEDVKQLKYEGVKRLYDFIVLRNGKMIPTVLGGFVQTREEADLDHNRVTISLPKDQYPDEFNYEIYFSPILMKDPVLAGFEDIFIDLGTPSPTFRPVELKLLFEGSTFDKNFGEMTDSFEIKSPKYVHYDFFRGADLSKAPEMPLLQIDDHVFIGAKNNKQEAGEVWMTDNVQLTEGLHSLRMIEKRALTVDQVKVKLANQPHLTNVDYVRVAYEIKEVNPTKYLATVMQENAPSYLILSQSYHPGWKASLQTPGQPSVELKNHFEANGFANGWKIPSSKAQTRIVMEYAPQMLMNIGILCCLLTLVGCVVALFLVRE